MSDADELLDLRKRVEALESLVLTLRGRIESLEAGDTDAAAAEFHMPATEPIV